MTPSPPAPAAALWLSACSTTEVVTLGTCDVALFAPNVDAARPGDPVTLGSTAHDGLGHRRVRGRRRGRGHRTRPGGMRDVRRLPRRVALHQCGDCDDCDRVCT